MVKTMLEIALVLLAMVQPEAPTSPVSAPPAPSAPPAKVGAFELFPQSAGALATYLENINTLDSSCLQPGALISRDPISDAAQWTKEQIARSGFEYLLYQSYNVTTMTERAQGDATIQAYTFQFFGNLHVYNSPSGSGWVTTELNGGSGLGVNFEEQNPQANAGTQSNPSGVWLPPSFWAAEIAWAMSMAEGKVVVVAGQVDQSNYLDTNTYSQNQYGQLMNEIFINSAVLPLPYNNIGVNVQWQPAESFYAMLGIGANNQLPADSPFSELGVSNVSYIAELGFICDDTLGLGKGVYRVQPFVATVEGETGVGVGLNIEQSLGKDSPLGVFGRFGVSQDRVATVGGASAQAAAGLAVMAPFAKTGPFSGANNNYIGLAGKWTRAAVTDQDEYGLEATYNLQVTPTVALQPDVQVIFDPVNNPGADVMVIVQFQVNVTF